VPTIGLDDGLARQWEWQVGRAVGCERGLEFA
jgi:hypothetical protein